MSDKKSNHNCISIVAIDTQKETNNIIKLSLQKQPVRTFYNNNHLFLVSLLDHDNKKGCNESHYFTYSIYKNNDKEPIRLMYISPVHPMYPDIMVNEHTYKKFSKCRYYYEQDKCFIWTDESIGTCSSSKPYNKFNKIPNMEILYVEKKIPLCIGYNKEKSIYYFFYICYDIKTYNGSSPKLGAYYRDIEMQKFIKLYHFLSISKYQFQIENVVYAEINFNLEVDNPQLLLISNHSKSLQNKIKLCIYDNINNMIFCIPLFNKNIKYKLTVVKNVKCFTTVSLLPKKFKSNFEMYDYLNNKNYLKIRHRYMDINSTSINVSTGDNNMNDLKKMFLKKKSILKNNGDMRGFYRKDIKNVAKSNINTGSDCMETYSSLDINKLNNFIIILNNTGLLQLYSD
ncbi:conserved membrane protein, unknown function, partial [Hepatocystis sp. ex Piliocolobus tephrosceles]